MRRTTRKNILVLAVASAVALGSAAALGKGPGGGGKPGGETAGNNLSYPVLWAEGVTKALPGTPDTVTSTQGAWWYQWGTNGTDPDVTPASCAPDPDNEAFCDDGIPDQHDENLVPGDPSADNPLPLAKAFLQKDADNVWQAGSADVSAAPLNVHWIDWGDNLESVDWYLTSQVRTEVVLFQDLDPLVPMTEYEMRHTSGWGINEVHGLAADLENVVTPLDGTRATVYSHCARLTIQKLMVDRDDPLLATLEWVPGEGWTEPEGSDLINLPIFNKAVYEGGDGPGYYSAEINVKGRIIFGYTWNVRNLNDPAPDGPAGDYRITFSLDPVCGTASLNTYFVEGTTQIIVPLEEELEAAAIEAAMSDPLVARSLITAAPEAEEEPVGGGAVAKLDFANNLTYMDVRILESRGGGGGGGKKGGR